jgi:hypothetical protein
MVDMTARDVKVFLLEYIIAERLEGPAALTRKDIN